MNKSKILNTTITIWSILVLIGTAFFILAKTKYLFVVDSDVLWHIKTGDFILQNKYVPKVDVFSWHEGLNWIPHEWLYDVFLSIIYGKSGLRGIMLFAATILIARISFVTIYNVVIKKENIQAYAIFTSILPITIGYTWAVGRPLELTMIIILTNLVVFIKKRKKIFYYLTLGLSSILVSNMHGGAIWSLYAPIFIMLMVDIAYFWKEQDKNIKKEHKEAFLIKAKAILIGVLLSLINPHGIKVYDYFIKMLFTGASEATNTIPEWQPIVSISIIASLIFVAIFVSFAFNKKIKKLDKQALTKLLIISFWGVGMLSYCRLTPIFIFTVLLWGYEFVKEFIIYIVKNFRLQKLFNISRIFITILGVFFIVLTLVMGIDWFKYYFTNDEETLLKDGFPYEGIKYLKENNINDKIYNDTWGSWMLFNDIPTFVDGRCDPFVKEFSPGNNQFVEVAHIDSLKDYLEVFEKYDIEYVFIKYDKDTQILLESTGVWEAVVIEERAMLFKRNDI